MNLSGIINIYKEQNMTSHDVVGRVRRILHEKRVGHTGTLDPMATGVLPVCVGGAARVTQFLETDLKTYRAKMKLGIATNTYDIWGEVTEKLSDEELSAVDVTLDTVNKVFSSFQGKIEQMPPIYSAVKVDGKRLYEYARKGKDVEIPKRTVYIKSIEVESVSADEITFTCECTKGTFIRSICHDAGKKLGTFGALSELERIGSGPFDVSTSIRLDELERIGSSYFDGSTSVKHDELEGFDEEEKMDAIKEVMLPPDYALSALGTVYVSETNAMRLINGLEIEPAAYEIREEPEYKDRDFYVDIRDDYKVLYKVYGMIPEGASIPGRPNGTYDEIKPREDGSRFVGVARLEPGNMHLHPEKIFI